MTILHTSDLHLRETGDERWNALKAVVDTAGEIGAQALTISGDLFDRDVDAEKLRVDLRSVLSRHDLQVVMVSGNHDANSFREGLHFGENVSVITDYRQPVILEDSKLRFWGLPYDDLRHEETFARIDEIADTITDSQYLECLLYHGQLIHPDYRTGEFGDEGDDKYMPVQLNDFDDSGIDYVLGGHYHKRSRDHAYTGGTFLYPGSPVPVTLAETGPRNVFLVESETDYEPRTLKIPCYRDVEIVLEPEQERTPREQVLGELESLSDRVKPIVTIRGYFDGNDLGTTEKELRSDLKTAAVDQFHAEKFIFNCRDVSNVVDTELYSQVLEKLTERQLEDEKLDRKRIKELTLQAMMQARQ